MADSTSGNRPPDATNGSIGGQLGRSAPASGDPLDEQALADGKQAASDSDLAHGVDPAAHEFSRDIRERSARQREQTASARLESAEQRDAGARTRDLVALIRDQAAAARDLAMTQRDAVNVRDLAGPRAVAGANIVTRAADQRERASHDGAQAADNRAQAAADRRAALHDREQAARDRLQAHADREALTRQAQAAEVDPLTGARTRFAGLTDLDHELIRTRRTGGLLVVACIDVVGLHLLTGSAGQAAADSLLQRVVLLAQAHLRSYDLIVRLGANEFLCAMTNMTLADARDRFSQIAGALAATRGAGAIRAGFAELTAGETATELVARADDELINSSRHSTPG